MQRMPFKSKTLADVDANRRKATIQDGFQALLEMEQYVEDYRRDKKA